MRNLVQVSQQVVSKIELVKRIQTNLKWYRTVGDWEMVGICHSSIRKIWNEINTLKKELPND